MFLSPRKWSMFELEEVVVAAGMMACAWVQARVRVCMTYQVFRKGFMRGKQNKMSVKKYNDLPGNIGQ